MLGLRGARLALTWPELLEVQVRALAGAVAECRAAGGEPRPELLVPLVASSVETELIRDRVRRILDATAGESGGTVDLRIGAVLELPRATVTADRIAGTADFFAFGTDDLTQTVWGLSREDAEAGILPEYLARGILAASPFESLDGAGVGHLISRALRAARRVDPGLRAGVYGSHGSDAASIRFFHTTGVDHVSCRPQRVPVARLEAGRAALGHLD
jgi:pyruvate,orthophosphate dikinase